ncbi:MAG: amidohydrolase family protein, partial [Anaerolineae bacterium]|nr:amidohydrolase family protein [Anaerolineae bacterium]
MLDLTTRRLGKITVIEAIGRIDSMSADKLLDLLRYEIETRRSRIILDMAQVNYLSGAGLKVLKNLNDETGEVRLSRPSDRVREVLQIIGLDATFKVHENRLDAIRSIAPITNAHTHLELGWMANYRPGITGQPFLPWIAGLMAQRRKLGADWDRLATLAIEDGIQTLLESGTTVVGDISTTGKSIKPLLESGLQGIVYVEVLTPWSREVDERMDRARTIIDEWRPQEHNGMRIGLTIHTPYTTHPLMWKKALDYARAEKLPLCIHIAESPAEYEFMTQYTGAIAEHHKKLEGDFESPLTTPVRFLEDIGALELKPLLVHAVQVDDDDIQRIKASGAGVVHCPRSNLLLQCGRMPLEKYLEQDVPVYMGTDSLGSSPSLNVLDEVETAVALHWG